MRTSVWLCRLICKCYINMKPNRLTFATSELFGGRSVNAVPQPLLLCVKSLLKMGLGRLECQGNHSFSSSQEKKASLRRRGGFLYS